MNVATVAPRRRVGSGLCLLCGAPLSRASEHGIRARGVCGGCAERLELELTSSEAVACPDCGRHQELCALIPCSSPEPKAKSALPVVSTVPSPQLDVLANLHRRQLSGAERVRAIEHLAATRLGVRELGRRTGFAASTISRWLKIDRCPPLKKALESGALDIGRAKLLADAPEWALAELIPQAPALSRADLARRVAAMRISAASEPMLIFVPSADSQRLRKALRLVESISTVGVQDRATLEQLRQRVEQLIGEIHARTIRPSYPAARD
jgi:hypothetical protein